MIEILVELLEAAVVDVVASLFVDIPLESLNLKKPLKYFLLHCSEILVGLNRLQYWLHIQMILLQYVAPLL